MILSIAFGVHACTDFQGISPGGLKVTQIRGVFVSVNVKPLLITKSETVGVSRCFTLHIAIVVSIKLAAIRCSACADIATSIVEAFNGAALMCEVIFACNVRREISSF